MNVVAVGIGLVAALAMVVLGDWLSEEVRGRLDRIPFIVLRLAIRRLPEHLREERDEEWSAELAHILHDASLYPVTRLIVGVRFALGLLRTTPTIARELSEPPSASHQAVAPPGDGSAFPGMASWPRGGPTVLRILLGAQLRQLREASGINREDAGYAIRASGSKIGRLELGRVGFKERDISDLLTLYGVTNEQERGQLLALVARADVPSWWYRYSDMLPSWFDTYVNLEKAAAWIRAYEVQFVPGLLQTEEYAHAVTAQGHPKVSNAEIEPRVELRMTRQNLITATDPPHLWAVVDEAALRRALGSVEVMRAQIRYLIEVTALPNVTLQVMPFNRGGHAAAGGPFNILQFSEPALPDVVYLEQLTSALFLDGSDDVDRYLAVMDQLCQEAEPVSATPDILKILRDLGG